MTKFLDLAGVSYLVDKLKAYISGETGSISENEIDEILSAN